MNEPIYIKAKEPIQFDPRCVRCGAATKRKYSFDTATPRAVSFMTLLIPYSIILTYFMYMRKGMVFVPFCSKCWRRLFFPSKGSVVRVIIAVLSIVIGFYAMATEHYIGGTVAFATTMTSLIISLREDRGHEFDALPVRVQKTSGQIYYEFYSGYYYEKLLDTLGTEAAD